MAAAIALPISLQNSGRNRRDPQVEGSKNMETWEKIEQESMDCRRISTVAVGAEVGSELMRSVSPVRPNGSKTIAVEPLSCREREVLEWLSLGKSGPEIAMILEISLCTVRIHIRSIIRKMDASNIPHAVARGFKSGILG